MTEATGATGTQADPGTQPPAGTAQAQAAGAGEGNDQPESISLEEAKKLRSEAAGLRRRLKDLETEDETRRQASLSDHEKALEKARQDSAAEVAGRFHVAIRRSEVRAALSAAGVQPGMIELAAKADDFSSLKVNDEGEVEGLSTALDAFRKKMPALFQPAARPTSFDGGPRGTPASTNDMNAVIRRMAGR